MIRKLAGILIATLGATGGHASEGIAYVIPVVTAEVNGRVYTTTFSAQNRGTQDATCEAIYAVPNDPKGGTLRAMYTVPAGGTPVVEEDLLLAAGAVGTMRIACSAPVVVAARVQVSTDGGRTFDEGRTYPGLDEAGAFRDARTIRATSDLFVAEVAGSAVAFEAIVSNDRDDVLGRKTYELPAFAQQIVNLSVVRKSTKTPKIEIRLVRGDGAVVVGEETRDPEFLRMAVRRRAPSGGSATAAVPVAQEIPAGAKAIRALVTSPFQAAPVRDPFTGLDFFRNRWYDPRTGTFITPDPMGYADSPNLYAGFAGDPVNRRDPTGTIVQFEGSQPEQHLGYKDVIGWVDNPAAKQFLKFNRATRRIDIVGMTEDQFISRFDGTAAAGSEE